MRCKCHERRRRGGRRVCYTSNATRKRKEGTRWRAYKRPAIPCHEAPRFATLLRAFFAEQHLLKGRHGNRHRRWALGPSEDLELWSADTITGWLIEACKGVRCQPPEGFSWTSHKLRKGAAFVANAFGTRQTDIRYVGGWTTNSTVLESKYIDFAMLPTPAARLFFGYRLCKGAPHEGC